MPEAESTAVERELDLPVEAERLWRALTDPDAVAAWFGADVEWELAPGGRARFVEGDGTVRYGVVRSVEPARELRFVWWRAGTVHDGASEVTYRLAPHDAGTHLTVTERPVRLGRADARLSTGGASSVWTEWDGRLVRVWGGVGSRASARAGAGAR